jgi:ABC-type nitrate/sulfonate/bicarbonate transport system permease component
VLNENNDIDVVVMPKSLQFYISPLNFQELARDRLLVELAKDRVVDGSQAKSSSMSAAAVGASLGAGLGLVLAVVMGAGSALRKP